MARGESFCPNFVRNEHKVSLPTASILETNPVDRRRIVHLADGLAVVWAFFFLASVLQAASYYYAADEVRNCAAHTA